MVVDELACSKLLFLFSSDFDFIGEKREAFFFSSGSCVKAPFLVQKKTKKRYIFEAMATENPIRMSGSNERWSNSRQRSVPNRSGSAPPSMEGSFLAVDNILSRQGGSGYNNVKLPSYGFEEPVTTHPSYASKNNLNRLPSPPIYYPTEYQFIDNRVGRFRSNRGLNKVNSPIHLSQGTLPTHKEVSEDEGSQQLSVNSVSDRINGLDIPLSPGSQGLADSRQVRLRFLSLVINILVVSSEMSFFFSIFSEKFSFFLHLSPVISYN